MKKFDWKLLLFNLTIAIAIGFCLRPSYELQSEILYVPNKQADSVLIAKVTKEDWKIAYYGKRKENTKMIFMRQRRTWP